MRKVSKHPRHVCLPRPELGQLSRIVPVGILDLELSAHQRREPLEPTGDSQNARFGDRKVSKPPGMSVSRAPSWASFRESYP